MLWKADGERVRQQSSQSGMQVDQLAPFDFYRISTKYLTKPKTKKALSIKRRAFNNGGVPLRG
jgi:hypothetical protein